MLSPSLRRTECGDKGGIKVAHDFHKGGMVTDNCPGLPSGSGNSREPPRDRPYGLRNQTTAARRVPDLPKLCLYALTIAHLQTHS